MNKLLCEQMYKDPADKQLLLTKQISNDNCFFFFFLESTIPFIRYNTHRDNTDHILLIALFVRLQCYSVHFRLTGLFSAGHDLKASQFNKALNK